VSSLPFDVCRWKNVKILHRLHHNVLLIKTRKLCREKVRKQLYIRIDVCCHLSNNKKFTTSIFGAEKQVISNKAGFPLV